MKEYKLTDDELAELLDACKPTPCMMIGGMAPTTPAENAKRVWAKLAKSHGFEVMTVKPVAGKPQSVFTAEPTKAENRKAKR